jgi:hypothetical protein
VAALLVNGMIRDRLSMKQVTKQLAMVLLIFAAAHIGGAPVTRRHNPASAEQVRWANRWASERAIAQTR